MASLTSLPSVAEHSLRTGLWASLLGLVLTSCAGPLQTDRLGDTPHLSQPVELYDVPFFPQEEFQCGPAALAAALNWSGESVTPEELRPRVYLPARKGTLQVELVAAARRYGRIPYILEPNLADLLAEVSDGRPVIVLQNLGFWWYPIWHYAVVVGFDPSSSEIILRSGRLERHPLSMRVFERTWRRSDYWAFVVLPPGELPATAEASRYLDSVIALEALGRWDATEAAYRAALRRWPDNLVALMGLGNSLYAHADLQGALSAFRKAVQVHPNAASAHNNLAHVLAETGELEDAVHYARRAVELDGMQRPEYQATLSTIESRLKPQDKR